MTCRSILDCESYVDVLDFYLSTAGCSPARQQVIRLLSENDAGIPCFEVDDAGFITLYTRKYCGRVTPLLALLRNTTHGVSLTHFLAVQQRTKRQDREPRAGEDAAERRTKGTGARCVGESGGEPAGQILLPRVHASLEKEPDHRPKGLFIFRTVGKRAHAHETYTRTN